MQWDIPSKVSEFSIGVITNHIDVVIVLVQWGCMINFGGGGGYNSNVGIFLYYLVPVNYILMKSNALAYTSI